MNDQLSIFKVIALCLMGGLLSACGPRMQTVTDYNPPISDSGMRCVEKANQNKGSCESGNRIAIEQCAINAEDDADQAYALAKDDYTGLLELYIVADDRFEHDYAHFEEQKRLLIRDGELAYIRCSDDVKMEKIDQFPECKKLINKAKKRVRKLHPPREPVKPYPPNRESIYNRFVTNCRNAANDCQMAFEHAYQSCGGTITQRQVCISNCD